MAKNVRVVNILKKQILVGTESFEEVIEGDYFYIDKSLFIKEFLENRGKVTLITRPRRFGKTLNMSMLKSFFDIGAPSIDDDTPTNPPASTEVCALFDGLKIMGHTDIVEKHMHKYPVVSITLKNIEMADFGKSIERLKLLVSAAYRQNRYLYESDRLDVQQKEIFYSVLSGKSTGAELENALFFLTECLHAYHKKRVIVLIDEYDTPIDASVRQGYYDEMISFMRGFLGGVFKTNDYLEFGVLTGVQRVSGESLFSSFNNHLVCGIMNEEFSTCFGFTEEEVKAACEMYGVGDKYCDVKTWYDGYRFGGRDMYNPWSITGYLRSQKIDNYWVNTGSVRVLQDVFYKGDDSLKNELAGLLTGAPITMSLEEGITYPIRYANSNTFWTLLLNAGYIKPCNGAKKVRFSAELVNLEVKDMFSRYAMEWFGEQQPSITGTIQEFVAHLLAGNAEGVSRALNEELLNDPSCHDFKEENSYHMFIYGMLLAVSDNYVVQSNQESGRGRSDCVIKPMDKSAAAVVVEFKHVKKAPDAAKAPHEAGGLKVEAMEGLAQIEEKGYVHSLKREGYGRIFKYGIAFHKKTCEVAMEEA